MKLETKEFEMTHSDLTAAALSILTAARADENLWTPTTAAILNVFCHYPLNAFSANQVTAIANAVEQIELEPEVVSKRIAALVRAKALRSRVQRGVRLYEVALPL